MFDFFGNILYLLLLGAILFITYIVVHNSFSKEIISKQQKALIWNNSLIIFGIVLILATFFIFSWVAGIATIVFVFVVFGLAGRKVEKKIIASITDSTRKGPRE